MHGLLTYVDSVDLRSDTCVWLDGSVKPGIEAVKIVMLRVISKSTISTKPSKMPQSTLIRFLENSRGIHPPDRNAVTSFIYKHPSPIRHQ